MRIVAVAVVTPPNNPAAIFAIHKIISNENDSKAELNNISNNLKLVDGELFDIKSFKKSEKQQLKLLKERKLNLQNQKNEIKSLYQNEVSSSCFN